MAFFDDPNAPQAPDATGSQGLNANAPTAPTGAGSFVTRDANGNITGGGSGPGAGAPATGGNPTDLNYIKSQILATAQKMQASGQYVNPSVLNDPDYWAKEIQSKGGWVNNGQGQDNIGYFSSRFSQPEGAAAGGAGGAGGAAGSLGAGMGGDLLQPYTGQFTAPTGTDDPGFQFAVQQEQQGIERSAAAHGTLLTGGTLKDLASYTTGAALQDYAGAYNRANQTFQNNYGIFKDNQDRPFNKLYQTTGLGLQGANAYSGSLDRNTSFYNDATNPTNRVNLGIDQGNISGQGAINQGNTSIGYANAGGNLANALVPFFNRPKTTATYNPAYNPGGYGGAGAT